jgi:FixJ family two-component response regulator
MYLRASREEPHFPHERDSGFHIIDDDESVRAALDDLLYSVGLTPVPHASVSEFLAAKKPDVPGCLVLDVRMPGIRQLRTSP